jgi:radical SAM protein with 4Fe4S-binding SPASM domain
MLSRIRTRQDRSGKTPAITLESKAQLLDRNPAFCMAPWMHFHVPADGHVTPCCESRLRLGNINRQTFNEIWSGSAMSAVRAQMLRGDRVESCRKCYDKEDAGVRSLRQVFNEQREHLFDAVVASSLDGAAPNAKPVYWDIRFSNICNFRCRSCWHGSSSRWFADGAAIGVTAGDRAIIQGVEDADGLFNQLDSFLPHVEEIYFAGGEPLIMEEHYRLLDLLIERGYLNIALIYNTNLSVTSYKGRDVLDRWIKFAKVRVSASIDATHARGELMRKEQNWQETIENLRLLKSRCPHVEVRIETTVSILNVMHLSELVRELDALDLVPLRGMIMHLLQDPTFYNIRLLPEAYKAKVRASLAELEQWLTQRLPSEPDGDAALAFQRGQIGEIISYMDAADWSNLLPKFREMTARIDTLRGEATRDVFPELAPLVAAGDKDGRASDRRLWQTIRAWLPRF